MMTAREAANAVGVSLPAMKSRVQRDRAQLRDMLDACCEIAVDARGNVTDFTPRSSPPCCSPPRR
jgi:RNA polymerase sigma-70 factor (ECF subfamily)